MDAKRIPLDRATLMDGSEAAQLQMVAQLARRGDLDGLERVANDGARAARAAGALPSPTAPARAAAGELVSLLAGMGDQGMDRLEELCAGRGEWWARDYNADGALAELRLTRGMVVSAFKLSWAGPCLLEGRVTKATAKFYTVSHPASPKDRRIARNRIHTVRCSRCSGGASYPNGYQD